MKIEGKISHFGGPDDTGVSSSEDLAFWETWDQVVDDHHEALFLPAQPPGTTGLARRLNPAMPYIACRWDYDVTPRDYLLTHVALIEAKSNGRRALALVADWGPGEQTGRVCDVSPSVLEQLQISTDDDVIVTFPAIGPEPLLANDFMDV